VYAILYLAFIVSTVQEGLDSGIAKSFDPKKHLESLKKRMKNG
jgi:antitoxin ParD1/3/4